MCVAEPAAVGGRGSVQGQRERSVTGNRRGPVRIEFRREKIRSASAGANTCREGTDGVCAQRRRRHGVDSLIEKHRRRVAEAEVLHEPDLKKGWHAARVSH